MLGWALGDAVLARGRTTETTSIVNILVFAEVDVKHVRT